MAEFFQDEVGSTNFTELEDTPSSYSGQGGKAVFVKQTEDGLELQNIEDPAVTLNDLTDVDTTGKSAGRILEFDGSGNMIVGDKSATASTSFTSLTDTPSDYTGQAGNVATVNETEDGIVFSTVEGGGLVDSVFGRIGAVAAQAGDYDSSLITNESTLAGSSVTAALNTANNKFTAVNNDLDDKIDKVTTGITNNLLIRDAVGNAADSGIPFTTIPNKIDKITGGEEGNFVTQTSDGSLQNVNFTPSDFLSGQPFYLDVKDFGATGNGFTDDTQSVRDAVIAAEQQGKSVYFPEGTYIISGGGIFLRNNMKYFGAGRDRSILKKKANTGSTDELDPIFRERVINGVFQPVNNIIVEDLGFEGNGNSDIRTNKGAGLFRVYECDDIVLRKCNFYKSRGYGVGFQGARSANDESKRGPIEDVTIEDCKFFSNGLASYLLGSDTDDGLDVKSSLRLKIIRCQFTSNGDKGCDIRGRDVIVKDSYATGNASSGFSHNVEDVSALNPLPSGILDHRATFQNCMSYGNNGNGFSVVPQTTQGVSAVQEVKFINCFAENNSRNFSVTTQGTLDLAKCFVHLIGCTSIDPAGGTAHFDADENCRALVFVGSYFEGGSGAIRPANSQTNPLTVTGCTFRDILGTAITVNASQCQACITGNTFRSITGYGSIVTNDSTISGNNYEGVSQGGALGTGSGNRITDFSTAPSLISRSGSTLNVPETGDFFQSDNSGIVDTFPATYSGRTVTIRFTRSGGILLDGQGNLFMAGDFSPNSNDTITFATTGSLWFEVSRSVN